MIVSILSLSALAEAKEFWPVNFTVNIQNTSTIVGSEANLPIYITNKGIMNDSYVVNTTVYGEKKPKVMIVEQPIIHTDIVIPEQTLSLISKVRALSSEDSIFYLGVWVTSEQDEHPCNKDSDCNYLVGRNCNPDSTYCTCNTAAANGQGRCARYRTIELRVGILSLPEFDIFGAIQIIILSIAAFYIVIRIRK